MPEINELLQKRYRIKCQLGSGGMGAVYEAIDERFGEPIALKETLIDVDKIANKNQRDSLTTAFKREAETLAKAKHSGIPFVRDYFFELDRQFIVMELVEGNDLAETLEKNKEPFSVKEVLPWLDQLLDVLDYLHNLSPQIIHRDIKPQNLKLNRGKIKLLDFGIAKTGDTKNDVRSREKTFVAATQNYSPIEQLLKAMPPESREFFLLKHKQTAEQILKQKTDPRSDIYAVGATFYHLLTNLPPIGSSERILKICDGKNDPLQDPTAINPKIPASISSLLIKAMAIERKNRFSSANEMRTVLEKMMSANLNTGKKIRVSSDERSHVTGASLIWSTGSSFLKSSETQNPIDEIIDTQPAANSSNSEPSGTYYLEDIEPEKKDTAPELFPIADTEYETNPKDDAKLFWLLPIFAFALLAVGGIGSAALVFSNNSENSSTPSMDTTDSTTTSTPIESPSPTPFATPVLDPEIENRIPVTDTNPQQSTPSPITKPHILSKRNKKKETRKTKRDWKKSVPIKTSKKPKQTPKPRKSPARTPRPKDLKCIYNNSC